MPMIKPILEVQNADVKFRTVTGIISAVNDVSFSVSRGETLAIVGESGSGKSITVRGVMGMLPQNAIVGQGSKYIFEGRDISECSELEMMAIRGNRISMVFQEPLTSLNPVYKIGTQIEEIILSHRLVGKAELKREVIGLLEEVQLPEPELRYDQYPHELSGGQRQRIMIAMAIANKPDLLIADEPTTALDVTVQAEILSLMKRLQTKHNMAMILITHDLNVVRETSDRVVVMKKGDVVETGETQHVFSNPKHPYTQKLIDSEPKYLPEPITQNADSILNAQKIEVHFNLKSGGLFSRKNKILKAVDRVSANIKVGETVGIVGESGSGKSTLGMSLLRLIQIKDGEINFLGTRLENLSRKEMRPFRSKLQVVFQDPFSSLNPRMIIQQILEEGMIINEIGETPEERLEMIKEVLDDVQMPHSCLNRFPHEFSGGQRQRLAIARAIVLRPEFVLLDEPTSALDLSIQAQIIELLRKLQKKNGLSYLFISHDLKVVKALCHRVIVMKSGKVVEEGDTLDVLESPKTNYTKRLVKAAFEIVS
ncbi:microcin ABC transporter ATP-binding protein [Vibrio nigripulchritudo]|nr:microcin ABC transporter ATP-binding protein [Vibrio nigripulchritudo]